jgi:hypothetical protein
MKNSKILISDTKTISKIKLEDKNLFILFYNENGKLLLKYHLTQPSVLNNNSLYFLNNLRCSVYRVIFDKLRKNLERLFFSQYSVCGKLYMIGLGFKNFVLDNKLYILVGDCNYIVFEIPETLKIYCRKNQIYVLSINDVEAFSFLSYIKKIKHPNFYKGKGVLEFKNFKFTKLKIGKKQRFM